MRIAVLSDIHSNLEALEAVLELADGEQVDATFVLGDIVGYAADPVAVLERLRALPAATLIAGNHDLAATQRFDTRWFNASARAAIDWTRDAMTPEAYGLLEPLVPRHESDHALLVHGSVVDPATQYVHRPQDAAASFDAEPFDLCFFGHTHMPTVFVQRGDSVEGDRIDDRQEVRIEAGTRVMLNPGSVGQPRDGDARASYLVYEPEAGIATVHRVAYAIERAQAKILAAGLPEPLADRLAHGR